MGEQDNKSISMTKTAYTLLGIVLGIGSIAGTATFFSCSG